MDQREAQALIARRHPEWSEFQLQWRWLMDSYEGGERYRQAIYAYDWNGLPVRNLIRHKREYPDPRERPALLGGAMYAAGLANGAGDLAHGGADGSDAARFANDSDYELRRARTPVPTFLREAVKKHLAKIYGREVSRSGPPALEAWWEDVDGMGTPLSTWIQQDVAPIFLALGQIDVLIDHPPKPEGAEVRSRADQARLKLDAAVASYILPENLLWWRKDAAGRYLECLVMERPEEPGEAEVRKAREVHASRADARGEARVVRYRHWTAEESVVYDCSGEELSRTPHPFGRVPIVRVFDVRKPRCRNVGQARYEDIAERQREYYNRDSELILSDTTQAHPLLQGPEDYIKEDGSLPVGPTFLMPMKKNGSGGDATYQGFEVIEFPKGSADSLRENKRDIRDDIDRSACLTKPAGAARSGRTTVAQSGVSKQLDHQDGHDLMTEIVEALGRLEAVVCELALTVLSDGPPSDADVAAIDIVYPSSFSLKTADELAQGLTDFQALVQSSGECPELETLWLQEIAKENLKGQDQSTYEAVNGEIEKAVAAKARLLERMAEGPPPAPGARRVADPDMAPAGDAEAGAEDVPMTAPGYSPYPSNYGGW